jgi:hypothetical protein
MFNHDAEQLVFGEQYISISLVKLIRPDSPGGRFGLRRARMELMTEAMG